MASNISPWLWKMLTYGCSINEGRSAFVPGSGLAVSAYCVLSETGKLHTIKTIGTGFSFKASSEEPMEDLVSRVLERREASPSRYQYHTQMRDGSLRWLDGSAFFSDDGTVTDAFLEFASRSDFRSVCSHLSVFRLKEMCTGQHLKGTGTRDRLIKRLVKYYEKSQVRHFLIFFTILTLRTRLTLFPVDMQTLLAASSTVMTQSPGEFGATIRTTIPSLTALIVFGMRIAVASSQCAGRLSLSGQRCIRL